MWLWKERKKWTPIKFWIKPKRSSDRCSSQPRGAWQYHCWPRTTKWSWEKSYPTAKWATETLNNLFSPFRTRFVSVTDQQVWLVMPLQTPKRNRLQDLWPRRKNRLLRNRWSRPQSQSDSRQKCQALQKNHTLDRGVLVRGNFIIQGQEGAEGNITPLPLLSIAHSSSTYLRGTM